MLCTSVCLLSEIQALTEAGMQEYVQGVVGALTDFSVHLCKRDSPALLRQFRSQAVVELVD